MEKYGFWINSENLNEFKFAERYINIISEYFNMEKQVYNFTVLIEQDEDGWYVATVPDIQGCYTQGKTVAQVLDRIKEAIEVCLEADKENIEPMRFVGVQQVQVER